MIKFNLDSAISRLQYPYRIIRNKITGKLEPILVILTVNNKCNIKCRYCFGNYSARQGDNDFTTKELINIIDELYGLGTRLFTIHGGETLLREDIGEIVNYIKKKRMYANLITNGILLKKKIDEIRNVDSLCISFDGREEGNDRNRGKGMFKSTLEAIRLAKREGFHLRVHATITRYTMNDVGYLAQLAREIGYLQEFSILYQCGGVSQNFQELMLSDEETKEVIREIMLWKKRGFPIYTAYRVLENTLNWPSSYNKPSFKIDEIPSGFRRIPCFNGKTKFTIDADGCVYPCFATMDQFKALNIRQVGVKKAIQHVIENKSCVSCIYLPNNDHNLLLNFKVKHVIHQCRLQLQELFSIY